MQAHHVIIGKNGRIVLPAEYRKALSLQPGDDLIIRLEDGEIRLFRRAQALQKLRAIVKIKTKKMNYTDDFLTFRKADSE